MLFLYNLLIHIATAVLHLIALFNKKITLFIQGRKASFAILKQHIQSSDRVFWIHVASLGEYEQGLPIMEALKQQFPNHKIVLTFFSPSGYEVKKNNTIADATLYLPMDTLSNAKTFLKLVHPEKVFFVKYEYWPNYLHQLKKQKIETYLVSGIFRPNQVFFKWYGSFYRNALQAFSYFFVQNEESRHLLSSIQLDNTEVVGDTRFDRVSQILERDNTLPFLEALTQGKTKQTLVVGSSWPQDEKIIVDYINQTQDEEIKFVLAPHNIKPEQIHQLYQAIDKPKQLHSAYREGTTDLSQTQVYIIDAYSLLTKAYSYATIAYVGGGFGAGIHNILEAATFGVPILIGPNYKKFQEAKDLIQLGSCIVINNEDDFINNLNKLLTNDTLRCELNQISSNFILGNKAATNKIINHVFN
ncbi:3-deoxy-D-manno-octulosonic acid transferase [Myroides sp. 1354]|uniref:3-deoxy-D-manno-octulosonic acid transferase n=1 Tax=unclassified Myroides TaxID=2642485 RepID=UPI0025760912|nr:MULTISPECIES: glycosyltransferase N-terminal domain-containing protein [unclassified Myroides]MDM1044194.1 3-deoxy-D-manno-octulosonic acid transferase [Myroides sp. R163-1]MDM1055130.1 3-deoxy-D-manno-octulosonic acid transferase [Myroides sp. 1354]MDM1068427.1 3-deoxy-D-manno-octulosonic acid transferase [Myroides sp. 1372]